MNKQFTHFTNSKKSLLNILDHGFAWMRNDRVVIELLLPNVDFSKREPQSFGQVCFTENTFESNRDHTKFFGSYGIQVSSDWAGKNKIQPVVYIPENGPILDSLRFLFDQTYQKSEAEELYPKDLARQQWMVSAAMASVTGKPLYSALLNLYQYMEPAQHSAEHEWRIVNPNPDWGISNSTEKAIKNVSPPQGWATVVHVVPIEPDDIVAIFCRKQDAESLSTSLQNEFRQIPISAH
jgi:hypothetical protein